VRGFCCCGWYTAGNNKEGVMEKILNECNTPSPLPSPPSGEGKKEK